ncbi:hypothetical protein OG866_05805 [Streptomyces sp. NBC_00663]|uniref:hypothetical protein n=1 Tax=Streptomyces sp. NBC_00663 TaxID=2975801 RepID=UPI002E3274F3|nr:hypothetical protein [Streptomyces sp. NBC_00663]
MSGPPPELIGTWVHSYEEDSPGVTVYRPAGYPFPPARGRRGLEFAADGTFRERPLGRGDAAGCLLEERRLRESQLEILYVDEQILKVRTPEGGPRVP